MTLRLYKSGNERSGIRVQLADVRKCVVGKKRMKSAAFVVYGATPQQAREQLRAMIAARQDASS